MKPLRRESGARGVPGHGLGLGRVVLLCLLGTLLVGRGARGESAPSWPQFRGPGAGGVAERDRPPTEFGPTTRLLWRTGVPGGVSSPCVWGEHVFLTAFSGSVLETLCLARADGRVLWRQTPPTETILRVYEMNSPASATPATDGRRVYVYFASYGLLAYDFDGRERWRKPLPAPHNATGSGTSPVVAGRRLLLVCDQEDGLSHLLAVAVGDGRTLWRTPRPEFVTSYSTPILWRHGGSTEIVVAGSQRLVGYALSNGRPRWFARGLEATGVVPTPALEEGRLFAMSLSAGGSPPVWFAAWGRPKDRDGDGRLSREEAPADFKESGGFELTDLNKDGFITEQEWDDFMRQIRRGEHGILSLREPGTGDLTETHTVWKHQRGVSAVTSPLAYRGRVYVVQDGGRVTSFDARTGAPAYEQERLGVEGPYHASPVAADGRIYFCSKSGTVAVVQAGDRLEVLARNALGDIIIATPAIADDKLYVRTAGFLWAFGGELSPRR